MGRQKVKISQLIVPGSTPDGYRPAVSGGELVYQAPGAGGGGVSSVVAGAGIAVDSTDPANPVVSATGGGGGGSAWTLGGSTVAAGITSDTTSSGTVSLESWSVTFACAVRITGFYVDLPQAGTYRFEVDGAVSTADTVVGAAANNVYIAATSPVDLANGAHTITWRVVSGSAKIKYTTSGTITGTGAGKIAAWGQQTTGSYLGVRIEFYPSTFTPGW